MRERRNLNATWSNVPSNSSRTVTENCCETIRGGRRMAELASGTPYPDADMDGIADDCERAHGMDPANATTARQIATEMAGRTEEFLGFMAGDTAANAAD